MSAAYYQDRARVVDAVTGVLSANIYRCLVVDTSNAMLWSSPKGALMASSGLASVGRALSGVRNVGIHRFRHSVAVVQHGRQLHVLRFDGEPTPAVEPDREASVVVARVR